MNDYNPYAAPKSAVAQIDRSDEIWRDGKHVLFDKSIENFPPRCICCGAPAVQPLRSRHLRWVNPWWYLILIPGAFAGLIIAFLVLLFIQKRAKVRLGMCKVHRRARNRRCALALGSSIAAFVLTILVLGQSDIVFLVPLVPLVPLVCLAWILGAAHWARYPLSVTRFEGDIVRAKGCGEDFLKTLSVYDRP